MLQDQIDEALERIAARESQLQVAHVEVTFAPSGLPREDRVRYLAALNARLDELA